jgi:hypothetical protein
MEKTVTVSACWDNEKNWGQPVIALLFWCNSKFQLKTQPFRSKLNLLLEHGSLLLYEREYVPFETSNSKNCKKPVQT